MPEDTIKESVSRWAEETNRALKLLTVVAETVREAGRVPSGTVYAALVGRVTIEGYQSMLRTLKNAGLVEEKHHELFWIGPKF